ncbi:cytochrome b5 domain-containing protein [Alteribacter natronophilus]|uniref:cytochrome b5 domain-containing protein n=1 Tax=Alteribacter natronophilus TaxID=2583810 RepID=UPI00110EB8C2|nr:cytochrome b5 domain-containing protein [Alteribacter natronophilus]TMW71427.1 cytochrome b5 [Alteribacter natronophilus]
MSNTELLRMRMNQLVTQARYDLSSLRAVSGDTPERRLYLQRLWDTVTDMHVTSELLAVNAASPPVQTAGMPGQVVNSGNSMQNAAPGVNSRTFTVEELARYDGKNGRAAYVAVNGIVYDVTNNRTWAAATHFGLPAGKDHTAAFASCHAGQEAILAQLPVVGRLVQ